MEWISSLFLQVKVGMAGLTGDPYTLAAIFAGTPPVETMPRCHAQFGFRDCLHRTVVCAAVLSALLQTGCVRRRLMIRSNPPGALVYVDNQPIGTTPCATDFTYYGTREIRLVKAGYETLTVNQPLPTPWYQVPPLDFVSENLVPRKIQDYRTASFNLTPQVIVPTEQLIARGEQLRQSTLQGAVLPAGAATPVGPVIDPGLGGGQPMFVPPTLGQPTLAPPQNLVPTPAVIPPGPVVQPPPPGTNTLPIGGQPIEALPPPRP